MNRYKIYHKIARTLAKIETLPNRKNLLDNPPETLIIDVTEQPIERPVKNQKYIILARIIQLKLKYLRVLTLEQFCQSFV